MPIYAWCYNPGVEKLPAKKVGRPQAITAEIEQQLIRHLSDHLTVEQACLMAGIGARTFYDYMEKHEGFRAKVQLARESIRIGARRNVKKAIDAGSTKTSMQVLQATDPEYKQGGTNVGRDLVINVTRGEDKKPKQVIEVKKDG